MNQTLRARHATLALPLLAAAALLAGCSAGPSSAAAPSSPTSSVTASVQPGAGGGNGGAPAGPGGSAQSPVITTAPATGGSPVERYAGCLTAKGFRAVVIEGDIAYQSDDSGAGRIEAGEASRTAAEAACRKAVPGYRPLDMNQK